MPSTTTLHRIAPFRTVLLSTIVLFAAVTPLPVGADRAQSVASASEKTADVARLADRTLERDLSHGDEHRYAVALTADEYVDVRVERRGVDVIVRARGIGDRLLDFKHDVGIRGEESIELVAGGAGATYILTLTAAPGTVMRGSYTIRVASRRPATDADRAMQDARALCAAAAQRVDKDDLAGAVPLLERALTLADGARGPKDPQVAFVTARLADVYLDLRDAPRAEPMFERTLAIMDETPGRNHPSTGFVRARLARLYQQQGEPLKAETLVKEALDVIERGVGPDHLLIVRSLMVLEVLRDDAEDLEQAKDIVDRQLSILARLDYTDTVLYAQVLSNLGSVYLGQDDPRAEEVLKRSLALSEKLRGPQAYAGTNQLVNLGIIARARKDYAAAEEYYQRAFAIRERMLGPDNPDLILLLNNLANVYEDAGEPQRALEHHFRALRIEENALAPYHSMALVTTSNIAGIYTASGDVAKALAFRRRADAIAEQELALNLVVGSERQKLLFLRSMSERTDKTISLHLHEAPTSDDASALAALVVLQRKGRVLDAMTDTFAVLRRAADPEDRTLLDQLNATTAQLAHIALAGSGAMARDQRRQAIRDLEARKERLEAELSAHSAQLRAQIRPVTLEAVQAAIPDRAVLLEFAVFHPWDPTIEGTGGHGSPHYAAYVIGRHGAARGFDLGDADAINAAIDALRGALRDPARGDVQRLARALDERVMRPLRASFGDATQMLISPDGELSLVPFEALVDQRGRYLIEGYDISYLTSGRDLLRMQAPRLPRSGPMIIADPLFGEPAAHAQAVSLAAPRPAARDGLSQVYFAPLAGTAGEARAIKALFPEATLLSGSRATKAAIQLADAPRLLHVASHAFFLPEADARSSTGAAAGAGLDVRNPLLRSGLALAGANSNRGAADAGILTALEASRLNLWGTKLVTLSACDTGVGDIHNGEGVYGLRRAFVLAGAETVVMTLWPVSDGIAREPMAAFYASLRAGDGRGDALRQAKLAMLKQKRRQHPFYWAGFVLSGQWTGLDTR